MAVLKTSKLVCVAITDSQDEIAGSFSGLETVNRLIEGFIPLQDISHYKGKRVAKATLLSERLIVEIHSYLTNGESMRVYSRKYSNPATKTNIEPGLSELR